MIHVLIKKQDQVTNMGLFQSMEEAQSWLDKHEKSGTFGQKAQQIEQQVEVSPAVIDEEGNEISPAVTEMQLVDIQGYVAEVQDISEKISQEKINEESLKLLADTDWMIIRELDCGIACPAEIKQARAEARAKIVR
jgi:hypothetical protein